MSKYNSYARKLNEAFKEARDEYNRDYAAMKEAEQEYNNSMKFRKEKKVGENEALRRKAELKYIEAKETFKETEKKAWPGFQSTVKQLSSDLAKEIKNDNLADSDALDDHALKLLESGLMKVDDYASMFEKFDNNPTMLRFVSKYAGKAAEGLDDTKTRARLLQIEHDAKDGLSSVQRNWNTLVNVSSVYSGENRYHNDPGFISSMSEKWDNEDPKNPQGLIESF